VNLLTMGHAERNDALLAAAGAVALALALFAVVRVLGEPD
jgi:hypothetical protein